MSNERERDENEDGKPSKFKIVDKRRINADDVDASDVVEEAPKPKPEPEKAAEKKTEAPKQEASGEKSGFKPKFAPGVDGPAQKPEEIPADEDPLAFRNIILNIMQSAVTVALIDLGLVPHPQTNLVVKKLEDARKAIDLFGLLLKNYGTELPDQLRIEFERALQDLKANYVNQA